MVRVRAKNLMFILFQNALIAKVSLCVFMKWSKDQDGLLRAKNHFPYKQHQCVFVITLRRESALT